MNFLAIILWHLGMYFAIVRRISLKMSTSFCYQDTYLKQDIDAKLPQAIDALFPPRLLQYVTAHQQTLNCIQDMPKLGGAGDRFGDCANLLLCKWAQSTNKHKIHQTYYQNYEVWICRSKLGGSIHDVRHLRGG